MTDENTRVLLYGRTSLDRSDGQSVTDQLTELRGWARRTGRTIVGEHRDDGISASRFARGKERPGWRAVLDAVDRGDADELALWEGSRGSRDLVEWVRLIDVCAERRVMIVVRERGYDPRDPDDRERLLYDAVRADHESGRTSRRVTRSVVSRATSGRAHGALNYGYKTEYDPTTGKPLKRVPDPERAPYVVEAIDRLLSGESSGSIVRDFTARGVPTHRGGKWNQANLIAMVRKPAYAGLRASGVHELPEDHAAAWDPIISRETHDRLLAMLADPSRRSTRNGRVGGRMLTGIARCGQCGEGTMRAVSKVYKTGTRRPIAYQCRACLRLTRNADPVDDLVTEVVLEFLSRGDVAELLADPADTDRVVARAEVARLRAKLVSLEAELDAERDDTMVKMWGRRIASAVAELEQAETAARPRHVPGVVFDVAGPGAAEHWDALPTQQRRTIIRALFVVTIHPTAVRNRFDPDAITVQRRTD